MGANYYQHGDFNRICDRCGFKVKASDTRKEWNGSIVCASHYDERHPQDFLRGKMDRFAVQDARPMPDQLTFIEDLPGGRIDPTTL